MQPRTATARATSVKCSIRGKRAGTRRTGFELLLLEHALLHGGTVGDEDAALHAHLGDVRGKAAAGPVLNVEEEQLRCANEAPLLAHGGALAPIEHREDGEVVRGTAELDAEGLHGDGHRLGGRLCFFWTSSHCPNPSASKTRRTSNASGRFPLRPTRLHARLDAPHDAWTR